MEREGGGGGGGYLERESDERNVRVCRRVRVADRDGEGQRLCEFDGERVT